ncbi:MAG: acyl-CoA dehydrogenase family protein [Nannocystaceae bacterium]|nr:acyl-CoA dehydrogenase family protein [Nannocystaceae bacterium]
MNFELDEDTILLRDSVRELGKQKADAVAGWESARALPEHWLSELEQMGLLAMRVPEADGGAGLSTLAALAVLQELGAFCASTAVTVAVHNLLGLGLGATGEEPIGLVRGVEATASSDGFVVHGVDRSAVGATRASRLAVVATVQGSPTPILVSRTQQVAGTRSRTLGLRAADIGSVGLDGVPAVALPGDLGTAQTDLRLAFGFIAAGVGRAALAQGIGYARERQQFGKPIAKFQAIQWKLADLATGLDAAELMLGSAANRADEGRPAAAARATLAAVQAVSIGCSEMLQIHGGYGYTEEYAVERLYRDAKALALYAGVRSDARTTVAEGILARFAAG